MIAARLGCLTSVNIWRETITYDELTINERQKTDSAFGALLSEVRVNCITEGTIEQLQKAVIKCTAAEKFLELQTCGQSPVCLLPTRKACDDFNNSW